MWCQPGSSVRGVVATTPAPKAWTVPRTSAGASIAALVQLPTDANTSPSCCVRLVTRVHSRMRAGTPSGVPMFRTSTGAQPGGSNSRRRLVHEASRS